VAVVALVFFQPSFSAAYELNRAVVTENNGIFQIIVSATLNAPAEYIRQVLTDYRNIHRLSSSIVETEVIETCRRDETLVRTIMLACVSVFCREVERVETVRALDSGDLQAHIVPEQSEFRSGLAIWKITAMDYGSELEYNATLEPDFNIPPVLGVPAIRRSLKAEFIATVARIEKIASINAQRDWSEEHAFADADVNKTDSPCNKN
jgi:hypothetical protein